MKISIATSVFNLRKSRPFEYYLKPAIDFIKDMNNSNIDIHVFTDQSSSKFPKGKNIFVHNVEIDELISPFWSDHNWRSIYSKNIENRPSSRFEEKEIPELIGIWLGKFSMVHQISKDCDCVLWQDSGICMGLFEKKFNKYKRCKIDPNKYQSSLQEIASKTPITLISSDKNSEIFHGVDMSKYKGFKIKKMCRAGLFLVNSNESEKLKLKIKKYWNEMISKGDFGTEENPLTLYSFERDDFKILSYDDWISILGIKVGKTEIKIL